jgi:hypothetical protein
MHSIASGSAAGVGLIGSAPPPVTEPVPDSPDLLASPAQPATEVEEEVAADTPRRLVIRMLGGEELELGTFDDRDDAVEAAQELIARFSSAEASGEWPEVDGRFLRPAAIASVDVLVRD